MLSVKHLAKLAQYAHCCAYCASVIKAKKMEDNRTVLTLYHVVENARAELGTGVAADAVRRFLEANPDPNVRMRPGDQMQLALDSGLGLCVRRGEQIVAASLIYSYPISPLAATTFSEIGTMRVIENGLGIQTLLAQVHIYQSFLENYEAGDERIFAVVSPGSASEHILSDKVKMVPWIPEPSLVQRRAEVGTPFDVKKKCLIADNVTTREAIRSLKSVHLEGNSIRTLKGNDSVTVLLPWFNASVLLSFERS